MYTHSFWHAEHGEKTQGGGSIFVGDHSTLKMLDCALEYNKAEKSVRHIRIAQVRSTHESVTRAYSRAMMV
jgi:hypothetical protein